MAHMPPPDCGFQAWSREQSLAVDYPESAHSSGGAPGFHAVVKAAATAQQHAYLQAFLTIYRGDRI